jgi:hypothetical protein
MGLGEKTIMMAMVVARARCRIAGSQSSLYSAVKTNQSQKRKRTEQLGYFYVLSSLG